MVWKVLITNSQKHTTTPKGEDGEYDIFKFLKGVEHAAMVPVEKVKIF